MTLILTNTGLRFGHGLIWTTRLGSQGGLDISLPGIFLPGQGSLKVSTIQHGLSQAALPGAGSLSANATQNSGGSFNPTSLITGAGAFWEADKGVTLSGSNVTAWADQSSFGNNLTTGGSPQFSATGWLSAHPGITTAGTDYLFSTGFTFGSSSTLSFFMLISMSGSAAANGRWMSFGFHTNEFNTAHNFAFVEFSTSTSFAIYQPNLTGSPITCGDPGAFNTAVLIGGVFDGANFTAWKNAVSGSSGACTDTFTTTGIGICNDTNGSGDSTKGTIAFVGVTQKAMNSTDWTNLKNYCNSTWGTSF